MKSLLIFLLVTGAFAKEHLVYPELINKAGAIFLLSADKCKEAFQLPSKYKLQSSEIQSFEKMRMERGKVLLSPYIKGELRFEDTTEYISADLSFEVLELKKSGGFYKDCSTFNQVVKNTFVESSRIIYANEESFIRYKKVGFDIIITFELSGVKDKDIRAFDKLLEKRVLPIFYNSIEEVGSCEFNASYDFMVKFKDVTVYDRICRYKKTCKKFMFFTTCKKRYRCDDIPHQQRYLENALLEENTAFHINISKFGNAQAKRRLLRSCIDGFITSEFYTNSLSASDNAFDITLTPTLRHVKDSYQYYDNEIDDFINTYSVKTLIKQTEHRDLRRSLINKTARCFSALGKKWLKPNNSCLKRNK